MIFTSPHPPADVADIPLTWYVLQGAKEYPDRVAVVDVTGETAYTYGELSTLVRRGANALRARGYGRGDVLAMLAPNLPEYPIAFHAAAEAGLTVAVLNPLDPVDELVGLINDAGARVVVTVPSEMEKVAAVVERTGIDEVIVFGEAEGATPFSALLADDQPPAPAGEPIDAADDVVALVYSSGSTGFPKGVMLTHRNINATVLQTRVVAPGVENEKVLAVPPFHHAFGLIMVMNAGLRQGATLVTMPRFHPEQFLQAVQDHRITRLFIVPTMAVLLARSPLVDKYDISSLRTMISGGATLDPAIAAMVQRRTGARIGQGYGLTEAMTSYMQADEPADPASVGRCAPNTESKIVDVETGAELGTHENGEVCVRGPHVMKGYLNAEEATRKVLDPDGFLHTGDLGYVDDAGELHIVDRIKELIKYNGQQVSPVELEGILMTHPKVADAAVVGVLDENVGELPKGFVVAKESATPEELMAFVAERVAPHKKIRRIEFIEAIPRTPVGKIERKALKARDAQATSSAA